MSLALAPGMVCPGGDCAGMFAAMVRSKRPAESYFCSSFSPNQAALFLECSAEFRKTWRTLVSKSPIFPSYFTEKARPGWLLALSTTSSMGKASPTATVPGTRTCNSRRPDTNPGAPPAYNTSVCSPAIRTDTGSMPARSRNEARAVREANFARYRRWVTPAYLALQPWAPLKLTAPPTPATFRSDSRVAAPVAVSIEKT